MLLMALQSRQVVNKHRGVGVVVNRTAASRIKGSIVGM